MLSLIALATLAAPPQEAEGGDMPLVSTLTAPLFLQQEQPETRSLRHIHLFHTGVEGAPLDVTRSPEEARELGARIVRELDAGADFEALAKRWSDAKDADRGAILGTFPRSMLAPVFEDFLFSAEVGEYGGPFETETGVHVLQRVERDAACLQILVRGHEDESLRKINALLERVRAGEDFAELAREHSENPVSAARGGQLKIYERGPQDRMIKAAAFRAKVGEVVGPVLSSSGYSLIKRVPVDQVDPSLRDRTWVRARAIVLAYDGAAGARDTTGRTIEEAELLAEELHARIANGEDMAELARTFDDDVTGRERGGDLGWLHRRNPKMTPVLQRAFLAEPGELLDPIPTTSGFLIVRRER